MHKSIGAFLGMAAAAFVVGVVAVGATQTSPPPTHDPAPAGSVVLQPMERTYDEPSPAEGVTPGSTGTNENGQTFGQWGESVEAALVEAIATNGQIGYVYAKDLAGPEVEGSLTPEKAAQLQPAARLIPVYLEDGVTQIGEFKVGAAIIGGESK
jgi:hypothetical protein